MKIKVKIKLTELEYTEFIRGLQTNYQALQARSFNEVVIIETIEGFLMNCFNNLMQLEAGKAVRNFTLNAVQAYSIYAIITNPDYIFTPLQSGINMNIAQEIDNALRANLTRRNQTENLSLTM